MRVQNYQVHSTDQDTEGPMACSRTHLSTSRPYLDIKQLGLEF